METSASFGQTISYSEGAVSLSEVLSALTFALDLTDGAQPGHSLRTCLLGMRLAEALQVAPRDLTSLYYALLLKDIGYSDTATRFVQIMGADDGGPWSLSGLSDDLGNDPVMLEKIWRQVLPEVPLPSRIGRLLGSASTESEEAAALQSSRVTRIMQHLGMGPLTTQAICRLDERWDGSGLPAGLAGESIPLLARICSVAQTLDAAATESGPAAAIGVVRSRRGTWFDPEIVRVAQQLHTSGKLWKHCQTSNVEETRSEVMRLDPGLSSALDSAGVDRICEAFGAIVDAKSPFTYHHSIGVTQVAVSIAEELSLPAERVSLVRRAAFLHDIGKLAVPNRILNKCGRLTPQEWTVVTRHPNLSGSILRRVGAFREIAALAAEHHERLDGTGYPFRLVAEHLSTESKLIAMADCYAAMAENRPYRCGRGTEEILADLARDVPQKLNETCFEALTGATQRWTGSMPAFDSPAEGIAGRSITAFHSNLLFAS